MSEENFIAEDEIEKEDIGANLLMEKPFDPKKIDIKQKTLSIDLIVKRLAAKPPEIDLYPDFQRKDDLWDPAKQSRLIESILISFPLPAFYFDGTNDNKWLVVDGLQRLSSFRNFMVTKSLRLVGLEFLHNLKNKSFDELPRTLQRQIEETQIVAYIINPGTPEEVKFNIFQRVNTGGLLMEPQEIRHALNQGIPAKFVAELASSPEFISATSGKIKSDRMLDREFVTRFVSFYIKPISEYKPDLDTYMSQKMGELKTLSSDQRTDVKSNFVKSMKLAKEIFSHWAFRKVFNKNERLKPINKALFEVWSVELAKLSDEQRKIIKIRRDTIFDNFVKLMNSDETFVAAVTASTGDKTKVLYRYTTIENLIKETLK
ncbi:DUF262 domain-containing protein [Mucilaginibacter gotjawali]|uniref:Uncharacterized protein n=2 Tax=Mucilaginibacter gotjawali TaxID=1550579 RepID=A0A839SH27_9SPHI|nr:DUF262 domain-containing protein [Mucilaginibacter gotjawali]MBB3056603.1 hypothetical protein [Mucilaginibacter gotjawali]BAU52693.1 hypothetical protein MgSA37_00855 [Mucilaginibacter gotjawali]